MDVSWILTSAPLVLTEGSMFERMRRHPGAAFDPDIKHAALIYQTDGRKLLEEAHREYMAVAMRHQLPMIVSASTWRANTERVDRSAFRGRPVNQDNVSFVRELTACETAENAPLIVAGVLACRGDAYRPEQALEVEEAAAFHAPQVVALTEARPDLLLAATLPALSEARGIGKCFEESGLPYILSFVVRDDGTLLDGTPLAQALDTIDSERRRGPAGYMVNCVHPTVLERCFEAAGPDVARRVFGLRANTSPLRPEELDGATELITEDPDQLAEGMRQVQRWGLRIIGGCCGTNASHIEAMATRCKEAA